MLDMSMRYLMIFEYPYLVCDLWSINPYVISFITFIYIYDIYFCLNLSMGI